MYFIALHHFCQWWFFQTLLPLHESHKQLTGPQRVDIITKKAEIRLETEKSDIMPYIDEKFKETQPELTVERIKGILKDLGIEIQEYWNDSGIDNCQSLNISTKDGSLFSNGKGITKEFARASAYGEFIERLQSGLFLYKYQSINRDPDMHLHTFAPDAKYMTELELIQNGEWMDHIIDAYGSSLTRAKLAQQCKMYACSDVKILTVPYYSLFEDKYVYLPTGFVEQMYSANGCCVGNTREEAWVHALSEIMERRGSIALLTGGKAAKPIPDYVLQRYPTAQKIINQIKASGNYDVDVFDTSINRIHPIITTRIINKENHTYVINTGSDPVFEIALHRTLTEIFQGRNIRNFTSRHSGTILNTTSDIPLSHNVQNLLETSNGLFTVDFFTDNHVEAFEEFPDNSSKTNSELLSNLLAMYRKLGRPVYVRNYSYLGFPCYKFVIPGFSESRGLRLTEPFQEYVSADCAAKTLRHPEQASPVELQMLLAFYKQAQTILSKRDNFRFLSGVPVVSPAMLKITLACVTYRLGRYKETIAYLKSLLNLQNLDRDTVEYFSCLARYLELKTTGRPEDQVRLVLNKFYHEKYTDMLYSPLDQGSNPFEGYVLRCDTKCGECTFKDQCHYQSIKSVIAKAGAVYQNFTDGQAKENFKI